MMETIMEIALILLVLATSGFCITAAIVLWRMGQDDRNEAKKEEMR